MRNVIKKLLQGLIKIYAYAISPLMGSNKCRFYPSCSQYAHDAFERHGIVKALVLSIYRILRCHPWNKSSMVDPVPLSIDWKDIIGYNSAIKEKCPNKEKN